MSEPRLTVVVLRGLWAAYNGRKSDMDFGAPGQYSAAEHKEFDAMQLWLQSAVKRAGHARVFPEPKKSKRSKQP